MTEEKKNPPKDTAVAAGRFAYLQDVMKQRNAALVGLSFCELEQGANLEPLGVPSVTSLKVDQWLKMQTV